MTTNLVLRDRENLAERNYIRKADPNANYWVDFAERRLGEYIRKRGQDFNVVIAGAEEIEGDFYAIPFPFVSHMLTVETLTQGKADDTRRRWIGNIRNGELKITHYPNALDVARFYGTPGALVGETVVSDDVANDYAIENRKAEVWQRVKQSVFRQRVLDNFGHRCCLSDIDEKELLVSSHIVPWSHRIETRLDPANGLCLSSLLDPLFDNGYFSLGDDLRVIVTPTAATLSEGLRQVLASIDGKQARYPLRTQIAIANLEYHRNKILRK